MKKVYIAAPFSANKDHTQAENIARAVEIGRRVRRRVFPIIPHIALGFIDEATERELAMERCKDLIDMCDEVWFYAEAIWDCTEGMAIEYAYALRTGKPVKFMKGIIRYQGGLV